MDVFELLRIPRPGALPRKPKVTLATVAAKVNGHKTDPLVLDEGLAMIAVAVPDWKKYITALEAQRRAADESKRREIRQELEDATDILAMLEEGEPLLREDHAAALAAEKAKAQTAARAALAADLEVFLRDGFDPFVARAIELLARAARLGEPALTLDITPPLQFAAAFLSDRRAAFVAGVAALTRKPAQPPAPQQAAARHVPTNPRPTPQVTTLGATPMPVEVLMAQRAPDDLEPLHAGEARVRVLSNGYSPSDDRPQCYAGQLVRMSEPRARHSEALGKVTVVERYEEPQALPSDNGTKKRE
jgi:hypothetical protein